MGFERTPWSNDVHVGQVFLGAHQLVGSYGDILTQILFALASPYLHRNSGFLENPTQTCLKIIDTYWWRLVNTNLTGHPPVSLSDVSQYSLVFRWSLITKNSLEHGTAGLLFLQYPRECQHIYLETCLLMCLSSWLSRCQRQQISTLQMEKHLFSTGYFTCVCVSQYKTYM